MTYNITIGSYQLAMLDKVEIKKSVELLAATCVITLPDAAYNFILKDANQLQRGDKVTVQLGYDGKLQTEFIGYLLHVNTDKENIELTCEDSLFLLRKTVKNKQFKSVSVKDIANYILTQASVKMDINCTMTVTYDKFTIANANAYDVLKKLQEDTKAHIWIETPPGKTPILHIHNLYEEVSGKVAYSMQHNVEESDLKYRYADDLKIQIVIKYTDAKGVMKEFKYGNTGGEQKVSMVSGLSEDGMQQRAKNEYDSWVYDGYEGDITGWLIPYCEPTYEAAVLDEEYPEKDGIYYVSGVETSFSSDGGKRKAKLSKKLASIKNGQEITWTT